LAAQVCSGLARGAVVGGGRGWEAAPADGGRAGLGAESVGGHGVSVGLGLHCVEIAWGAVCEIALVD